MLFFFFQAEDGIRDGHVTGVQTCALPISHGESEGYVQLTVTIAPEDEGSRLSVIGEPFFGDGLDGFDEYVDIPSIADSVRAKLERDVASDLVSDGDALDLDVLASDVEADAEGSGVAGATEEV